MGDIFAQRKAKIRTKLIVGTRVSSFISFNLCVKERKGKETPHPRIVSLSLIIFVLPVQSSLWSSILSGTGKTKIMRRRDTVGVNYKRHQSVLSLGSLALPSFQRKDNTGAQGKA